ncbi:MAG: TylF/MycF/NovP-related O-methyltransferase [Mycobacterium sp.]
MVRRLFGGFYEDGLFTITNSDFRRSEHFKHVYAAAKATGSFGKWNLRWRIHILCWAANHAAALDGDFVECGVDHGGTAMAAIVHTDFGKLGKNFWLLDTFKGLDRSQLTASEASTTGFLDYPDCFERVRANFAEMDFVRLVRGSVPSTLNQVTCENVAYLHLDMNCTAPEVAALEHFWPKLSPFGIVIMDDYGWPRCHEQKVGYDRFARDRDLQILQIPTGQGILVKPPS